MNSNHDAEPDVLAETEEFGFAVWRSMEEDGYIYHVEMGGSTIQLSPEEWEEFVVLIRDASG